MAVCCVCSAVVYSHPTYGATVAVIAAAAGPRHCNVFRLEITDSLSGHL
jgi:hypothetical protein